MLQLSARFTAQLPFLPHTIMMPSPRKEPKRNEVECRHKLIQSWTLKIKIQIRLNSQGQPVNNPFLTTYAVDFYNPGSML